MIGGVMPKDESPLTAIFPQVDSRVTGLITDGHPIPGERSAEVLADHQHFIRTIGPDANAASGPYQELVIE
jgi:hypothetical protein